MMVRTLFRKTSFLFIIVFFGMSYFAYADEFISTNFRALDPIIAPASYSTSTGFQLWITIGQPSLGTSTSAGFSLISGFLSYPFVSTPVVGATAGDAQVALLEGKETIDIGTFLSSSNGLVLGGTIIIQGGLTVNNISSQSEILSLMSDVEFFGTPYFTRDTAGFAVVKNKSREVTIVFAREYLEQPIVNVSISLNDTGDEARNAAIAEAIFGNDMRYLITKKSTKGFTILLNKPATEDIQFSWTAFAVKGAKTFESIDTPTIPVLEPTPESTPEITPETTPISDPVVEPSPEFTPIVEPTPATEPTTELTPII